MKTQKHRRKKKFGRFYLLSFGLVTVVLLALAAKQLLEFWDADRKYESAEDASRFSDEEIQEKITAGEKGDIRVTLAQLTNNLTLVGSNGSIGYGAVLYRPDSDEFYVSSPVAIALVGQEGDYHRCVCTDPSIVKKLEDSSTKYDWNLILHSIYYKEGTDSLITEFVPAETFNSNMTTFEKFCHEVPVPWILTRLDGKPMTGEWLDLTPDITEGWCKAVTAETKEAQTTYDYNFYGEPESDPAEGETELPEGCDRLGYTYLTGSIHCPEMAGLMETIRTEYPAARKNVKSKISVFNARVRQGWISQEEIESAECKTLDEYVEFKTAAYLEENERIPERIASEWYVGLYPEHPDNSFVTKTISVTYHGEEWQLFLCRYCDLKRSFWYTHVIGIFVQGIFLLPAAAFIALICAVIGYLYYSKKYDIAEYRRSLTGTLAHDLKTPLAVISGYAENLRAHTHPEKADSYADGIMQNVQHMDEMIAGVLELSRTENGRRPAMKEAVDLTALLHDAFARRESDLAVRGLTLKESGTLQVRGNAEMLRQLAENIAANAVQHCAEGGTVTVTAEGKRLTISNPYTGELDAKTLCEPFVRGDSARGMRSGSGLGLSIVQNIASLHKFRCKVTAKDGVFAVTIRCRLSRQEKQAPSAPETQENTPEETE